MEYSTILYNHIINCYVYNIVNNYTVTLQPCFLYTVNLSNQVTLEHTSRSDCSGNNNDKMVACLNWSVM